jgi:hypothetical protein
MFGWDQRTSLKARDEAMARVAGISDVASVLYKAVQGAELMRYQQSCIMHETHKSVQAVMGRLSVLMADPKERDAILRENDLDMINLSVSYHNLSIDFCERMLAIQAIWGPAKTAKVQQLESTRDRKECVGRLLSSEHESSEHESSEHESSEHESSEHESSEEESSENGSSENGSSENGIQEYESEEYGCVFAVIYTN